jgi:long-chain acyl-CoA synthetase
MASGIAIAPLFDRWPAPVWIGLVKELRAVAMVVEGPVQLDRLRAARAELPDLKLAISLDDLPEKVDGVRTWAELLSLGDGQPLEAFLQRADALDPASVALFTVTPGTVGEPRILRHSHAAVVAHAQRLAKATSLGQDDSLLSRLSPAVGLERALLHVAPLTGTQIHLAPPQGSFLAHLKEARPTLVHGTPDDWEALRSTVEDQLVADPPNRKKVISWACQAALEAHRLSDEYLPASGPASAKVKLAQTLVFQPLKVSLGLHAAKAMLVGQAPVRRKTLDFFTSLDLPLNEAWGLAEVGGPITLNSKGSRRVGTQGRPLPGIAVKIASDGEILLRTDTASIQDAGAIDRQGFLRTGDLGDLDEDGFLKLAGRRDELLALRARRKIPAQIVEARLCDIPLVAHAAVFAQSGDVVALLALDRERSARYAREKGLPDDPIELAVHPTLVGQLERDLVDAQLTAPEAERVQRFSVVPGGFSLDEGELTPSGTVRRKVVQCRRPALLEPLFERPRHARV